MNIYIYIYLLISLIILYLFKIIYNYFDIKKAYRLGDLVTGWLYHHEKYIFKTFTKRYPNTLGSIFIKRNKKNIYPNNELFFKIVDEEIKKRNIKQNHISLHLRMGDVIDNKRQTKYATNLYKLKLLLIHFKKQGITSNTIINIYYGYHVNLNKKETQKNEEYKTKYRQIFKDLNINYKEVNSGNPDLDYLEMANSKHFIQSGGGFSDLIAQNVKHRGNQVHNPKTI
jgi:hypothetical protein